MVYRNSETDAGRKGARSRTKADAATQYVMPQPKGCFKPAYGGSRGTRDDEGTNADEVGNNRDSEYGG